jgi:hypothetical protein
MKFRPFQSNSNFQAFSDDFWISYFVFSGLKNVIVNIFLQKNWLLGNRQTATKSVIFCRRREVNKQQPSDCTHLEITLESSNVRWSQQQEFAVI